jgi:hypothetical protein
MKLADEAVEKIAEVVVHLGEASIIAGGGSFFVKDVAWYFGVGGVVLGLGLIAYGVFLIDSLKSRRN